MNDTNPTRELDKVEDALWRIFAHAVTAIQGLHHDWESDEWQERLNQARQTVMQPTSSDNPDAKISVLEAQLNEHLARKPEDNDAFEAWVTHLSEIQEAIIDAPASTMDGMRTKARLAMQLDDSGPNISAPLGDTAILRSICRDLLRNNPEEERRQSDEAA
jgi:hypothetical protein